MDVARDAGVSIATVSAALNHRPGVSDATRERVVATANHLGWSPSLRGRSLSQKRAFNVGLVIQRDPSVIASDPFFAGFISGVESVLEDGGYALVLQVAPTRQRAVQRYRRLAADHRVDGVFLTDVSVPTPGSTSCARSASPPWRSMPAPVGGHPTVRQSHEPGINALLEHLVELGHRRIAHVSGPRDYIHAHDREAAWRAFLSAKHAAPGAGRGGGLLAGGRQSSSRDAARAPAASDGSVLRERPHGHRLHRQGDADGVLDPVGRLGGGLRRHRRRGLRTADADHGRHGAALARRARGQGPAGDGGRRPGLARRDRPPTRLVARASTGPAA